MRYILSVTLLWLWLINASVSAPLGIDITDPTKDDHGDKGRLLRAHRAANEHIDKMHEVIQNPNLPKNKAIIKEVFGRKANVAKIAANVKMLKEQAIKIPKLYDSSEPHTTEAFTTEHNKVHLGPAFHKSSKTDEHRGGILIHEAAHALFQAEDHHSGIGHSRALTGYIHNSDYETLRKHHSEIMHKNADSYTLFGHKAANGAHVLTGEQEKTAKKMAERGHHRASSSTESHTTGSWSGRASPWSAHSQVPSKANKKKTPPWEHGRHSTSSSRSNSRNSVSTSIRGIPPRSRSSSRNRGRSSSRNSVSTSMRGIPPRSRSSSRNRNQSSSRNRSRSSSRNSVSSTRVNPPSSRGHSPQRPLNALKKSRPKTKAPRAMQ